MRLFIVSVCAVVVLMASAGALAVKPAAILPSGATVDLNTGVVTTVNGQHYKLSEAQLKRLRERLAEGEVKPESRDEEHSK